jgi:type VI secretion system protein ImpE
MAVEDLIREGDLADALAEAKSQVRKDPADPRLRVMLFQLQSVLGDWERAITQLNVAADMDPGNLLLAALYRPALNAEALRVEIFEGRRAPHVFGEPAEYVGWLVQANNLVAQGEFGAAAELREQAYEAAPAVSGVIDENEFAWIADGDTRLGPLLEGVIDGKYYWIPFECIRTITIEEPTDLRDLVWASATFTWANGGEAAGLIPARYPGSQESDDPRICLARRTEWLERDGETYLGLGQRMLVTDANEYPLLATRNVVLGGVEEDDA